MALPTFIIIGSTKAGTTSLYHYMRQHPDVFMSPVKEPRYFINVNLPSEKARTPIVTLSDYEELFRDAVDEKALGEASVGYLAHKLAATSIHELLPNAKLIAVIRDPIDRIVSHYKMKTRDGAEERTFDQMLQKSIGIGSEKAPVFRQSFYAAHFDRFLKCFDRAQLHIGLYEDFRLDNISFVQKIFEFLDVDSKFHPNTSMRHNQGGYPKSRFIHGLVRNDNFLKSTARALLPKRIVRKGSYAISRLNQRSHPFVVSESQQRSLIDIYRDDVERLQEIVGRDLQHWLQVR